MDLDYPRVDLDYPRMDLDYPRMDLDLLLLVIFYGERDPMGFITIF